MIYYLKASDEASLWLALETANLAVKEYDPEDELNQKPDDLDMDAEWEPTGAYEYRFTGTALDIIGTIYVETGNMLTDDEGMEYPEMEASEGYHANLIANLPGMYTGRLEVEEGLPIIDAPSTPYRKWAGIDMPVTVPTLENE